jgi:hypothetical protein
LLEPFVVRLVAVRCWQGGVSQRRAGVLAEGYVGMSPSSLRVAPL